MGPIRKVVIDTNIFISGFGWGGKPGVVLTLLENNQIKNYISPEIFEELKRAISYPKLKFPASFQNEILEFAFFHSEFVQPTEHVSVVAGDPADDKFLECALAAHAEFVISGDPHLVKLGKYRAIEILNVASFLRLLQSADERAR